LQIDPLKPKGRDLISKVFDYLADKGLILRNDAQMEQRLNKLLGLLEQAAELYRSLLAVVQKEKDAVVGLNLQQLTKACKAKDSLLLKLRILEEQREQLIERLAADLDCPSQPLSLTQLSQLVEESYADRLRDCSADLLALITTLQEANAQNKYLLSHSLEFVRGSYNLLNNLMATNPLYYQTGRVQTSDQTGKLLCGDI
jgi:flagellar biosynthesis/type III secretory pathway chaperone